MNQDYYLMHKHALGQTAGPYTMPEAESHADHDPDAYTLLRKVRWDDIEPGLHGSFTGSELDALITTAVELQELSADVNLTRAQQDVLRKARAIAAADWDLPDGEKPAEYLGTTADLCPLGCDNPDCHYRADER